MAYDSLKKNLAHRSNKEYLKILHLAARESETAVDAALNYLIDKNFPITFDFVLSRVRESAEETLARDPHIEQIDLRLYDTLLADRMVI
jgi:hypothetical protein